MSPARSGSLREPKLAVWEAPRAGLRPQTTDSFFQSAIRNPKSEMLPLPPAGYLMQTFGLRPRTADRGPRRPSAATMDHRPSTIVYRLSSEHRPPSIVYRLITGRSLGLRSRDGHFSEAGKETASPHVFISHVFTSHVFISHPGSEIIQIILKGRDKLFLESRITSHDLFPLCAPRSALCPLRLFNPQSEIRNAFSLASLLAIYYTIFIILFTF